MTHYHPEALAKIPPMVAALPPPLRRIADTEIAFMDSPDFALADKDDVHYFICRIEDLGTTNEWAKEIGASKEQFIERLRGLEKDADADIQRNPPQSFEAVLSRLRKKAIAEVMQAFRSGELDWEPLKTNRHSRDRKAGPPGR